ncbi:MAG: IS110 family RNA-guided transposase, partial [Desulfuromonadales bacterium]
MSAALGIDIAKKKFDVALLRDGKFKTKVFDNSPAGFAALKDWLRFHGTDKVHACMEATGILFEGLATFLADEGHEVRVTNPLQIKAFGESLLSRTKTDKADARLIARFCETMKPSLWQPDPPEIRQLKALGRRRDALIAMRTQEINRDISAHNRVQASIRTVVSVLDQEIDDISRQIRDHIDNHPDLKNKSDLLRSIPGVGDVSIEAILSETNGFANFSKVEQVVAYMGLSPKEKSSGSSVRGKVSVCKTGNRRLRKILYMPALVAMQHNPMIKELAQRLKQKAKHGRVIACACMKKLIHIMFGVIKNNLPFNPA